MLNEKLFSKKNSVKKENKNMVLLNDHELYHRLVDFYFEGEEDFQAAEQSAWEVVYSAKKPEQLAYKEKMRQDLSKKSKLTLKEKQDRRFFTDLKEYFVSQDNDIQAAEHDAEEIVYNAKTSTQLSFREFMRLKLQFQYFSDNDVAQIAAYGLSQIDFNDEDYETSTPYSNYIMAHQELLNRGLDGFEVDELIEDYRPDKMFKVGKRVFFN